MLLWWEVDCAFLKDGLLRMRIKVRSKLKVVLSGALLVSLAKLSLAEHFFCASHDGEGESKLFQLTQLLI